MKGLTGKLTLLALIVTLFAGLMSSCSNAVTTTPVTTPPSTTALTVTATPASTTITITDDYNRTVTIKKYPQRIVSLSPANTEILFALGLNNRIVGVSDYSDYPEEAKTKPSVGAYNKPDMEKIIALEPDLVMASSEHEALTKQLESKGVIVVMVNPKTVDQVLTTMTLIGKITGQDSQAATQVSGMQQRMDAITAKTAKLTDAQRPRVFVVIWHDPIYTVGSGTFHDELIKMAGGVNIAGKLTGYPSISLENVIIDNPQVIIAGVGMGNGASLSLDFMKNDARLAGIDARINNHIYGANMDIVSRPGPRLADALEVFFKLVHPELQ
jgi:iron complex transport system substrate-binding protein